MKTFIVESITISFTQRSFTVSGGFNGRHQGYYKGKMGREIDTTKKIKYNQNWFTTEPHSQI